ncbi:MAG TPA: hypothetical protein VHE35_13880 [Kofleriaceae bacterium]|nr:hypothetical protein [Kofleriaceae bacterium]
MNRLVPLTAVLSVALASCASKARAAFTRRSDQIDRASWERVCGPFDHELADPGDRDARTTVFARQKVVPEPHMPPNYVCSFDNSAAQKRIDGIHFDVSSTSPSELVDAHVPVRDLARDLVPEAVWPYALIVAESPETTHVDAYHFAIEGGFREVDGLRVMWQLTIRSKK